MGWFNGYPSINRDGNAIAFESENNFTGNNPDNNSEIFLARSGEITQITKSNNGYNIFPAISSDGHAIVFLSTSDLIGKNADENLEVFLAKFGTITQITDSIKWDNYSSILGISSDGEFVVFSTRNDLIGTNSDENREIFLAHNGKITQITKSVGGFSYYPSITSDGGSVAFASDRDFVGSNADKNLEIFLTKNGTITQLTNTTKGDNYEPYINGDGSAIFFISTSDLIGHNADGNDELFLYSCEKTYIANPDAVPALSLWGYMILLLIMGLAMVYFIKKKPVC